MPASDMRPGTTKARATARPEILDVLGAPTVVKADPTVGNVLVAERTFPPGHSSPTHSHGIDDELIYVLEGELVIVAEGKETQGGPGLCVALPRGHARAYRNDSNVMARGLIISHPGLQAVELFRNLDRAGRAANSAGRRLSDSEVDGIARQYGVQVQR